MKYLVIIAVVVILIVALGILFQRTRKPAVITGWERVEKSSVNGNFLLSGEAVNYRDDRPYKLYMKVEGGKKVWYAEMQDTGEWYITDMGQQGD